MTQSRLQEIIEHLRSGKSGKPPNGIGLLHEGPLAGIGPVIVLDKSAFQGLARREHTWLHHYFFENVTPVLVFEIVGDLAKLGGEKPPVEKVQELARKFGGSGNRTNVNYRALCLLSLMGDDIPMSGEPVVGPAQLFRDTDGSTGAFVDIGPLNRILMKLADGRPDAVHKALAELWRGTCGNLSLDGLGEFLRQHRVILAKAKRAEEIPTVVDTVLSVPALQSNWVELLLALNKAGPPVYRIVKARWSNESDDGLLRFAPYAHYCLRALMMLFVACRDAFLKMQPTHLVDFQYLCYLPFCSAFSSEDRVHVLLAPLLVRPNQSFVKATDLKKGLKEIADFLDARTEEERGWIRYALAMYPPPLKDNVVTQLWRKHGDPWNSASRNYAIAMNPSEVAAALTYVEGLFRAAGLDVPLRVPVPPPWDATHASAMTK